MPSTRRAAVRFLSGLRGRERNLGRLIGTLRMLEGLSQSDLARRVEVSRAELCDAERDRRHVLPLLAEKLAVTLGYDAAVIVGFAVEEWLARQNLHYEVSLRPKKKRVASPMQR